MDTPHEKPALQYGQDQNVKLEEFIHSKQQQKESAS
jgi:hypothetical protein